VQAIRRRVRRLLILQRRRSSVQAVALETLVHAVEDGRIPYKRIEDALTRLRHAKERIPGGASRSGRVPRLQHCARLRRASAHRRGNVALPVSARLPARSMPATASPSSRPPAPSLAKSSTRASTSCDGLASIPVYDETVFAREPGIWRDSELTRRRLSAVLARLRACAR
jgi:hypothetical protein